MEPGGAGDTAAAMSRPDLPALLAALDQRTDLPPAAPREPLRWQHAAEPFGSTPAAVLDALHQAGHPFDAAAADPEAHLAELAATLRRLGLSGRWRDEAVRVPHPAGATRIERGCARVLGIRTLAVHLIGWSTDGRVWLQQRSSSKAEDPDLWDTLVGGMVSADESPLEALRRETEEEAGLDLAALGPLREAPRLESRRPVGDGGGQGYLHERLLTWQAVLPAGQSPQNRDGEVQAFALWTADEVRAGIAAGRLTLDAARLLLRLLPA